MPLTLGTRLGGYEILAPLGAGGMGEVYRARDLRLGREIALKVLPATLAANAERLARFEREARTVAGLNHPNIVTLHSVEDAGDVRFLTMELVDGRSLDHAVTPGGLPFAKVLDIGVALADALAAAHERGIVHRDLKPANVMVTKDGRVKVLDFGLAKLAAPWSEGGSAASDSAASDAPTEVTPRDVVLTTAGSLIGTVPYMSPEQVGGEPVDARSDIFSLGVVLYELSTGERPFGGKNRAEIMSSILRDAPAALTATRQDAPLQLGRIIDHCMQKDPEARFQTAKDVRNELRAFIREVESGRLPVTAPTIGRRRSLVRVGLLMLGVAVAAAGGVWWWRSKVTALPENMNVVVLAPVTPGADGDFASFALGAAHFVSTSLAKHADRPGFQLASFADGLGEKVQSAADARKVLGANLALALRLEQTPDLMRARLDLLTTDRGRTIASRQIRTPRSEPFDFMDRLARESAAMMNLPAPARDVRSVSGIRGAGTLRFFLQGVGRLLAVSTADDARRAAADFELACRTESDAAAPRAELAAAQLQVYLLSREPEWLANAEAAAREAVQLDSGRAEGYRALGNVLSSQKRLAEALPEYTRASELDPTDDSAWLALGKTYGRLERPNLELAVYEAAARRRPHDWRPHWWLGSWQYRHGHIDKAIGEFEAMTRCAPLLADGYAYLGGLFVLRGENDRAISTLKQALALRPTESAFDNLGTAYFNSGKLVEAADTYNQSLQFGTTSYASWLNLGDAYYWQAGRRGQAASAYAQGIRMARDEILARSQPGRTYDPTIPAALAPVYARLGESDSARWYLARALSTDSSNSTVQYDAALTHWQLQDRDRALAWLARAVAGGYPTAWLKDSPMFLDWREDPRFLTLIGESGQATKPSRSSK